jgi:hypothetical protein
MSLCRKDHTAVQMACFVWRKERTLVSTRHFVTPPTGFGRVILVSTLGAGRPKRHFSFTQGPESRRCCVPTYYGCAYRYILLFVPYCKVRLYCSAQGDDVRRRGLVPGGGERRR